MLNALYNTAERIGVNVLYRLKSRRWISGQDVRLRHHVYKWQGGNGPRRRAGCGGGWVRINIDWLAEYRATLRNFLIRGTQQPGIILKMLLDAGVRRIGDPTQCHAVAIDARAPQYDGGIITRLRLCRVRNRGQ